MDIFGQKNIEPMLIKENRPAFNHPDWLYELKFDGIRCLAYLDNEGCVLRNKRNKDVTAIYPELGNIHLQVADRCILDGEVFILKDGRTDFFEVQRRSLMSNSFKIRLAADKLPVSFVAFDILYLSGQSLFDRPLFERKEMLADKVKDSERLSVSRFIKENGISLFQAADAQGLEGIVAKKSDSKYYPGKRTMDWIKCTVLLDEEFVICGYFPKAENLVSIILGSFQGGNLIYRSHVVMGISRYDFAAINRITPCSKQEYYENFPDFENAVWIIPTLAGTVQYMELTKNGGLRQPVFKGIRDDKDIHECIY